jgi:hypothetical protein
MSFKNVFFWSFVVQIIFADTKSVAMLIGLPRIGKRRWKKVDLVTNIANIS